MLSQSEELRREKRAIDLFVSLFNGSYQKLDPNDIDYKVFDKDKNLIAYAEVVSVVRVMREAYPLPIDAKKLIKLADKRLNPVVIWSCEDGIIYCKTNKLDGNIKWEYDEFTVYAEKVRAMKYIRYT